MIKGSFWHHEARKKQRTNPFSNWLVGSLLIPYSLSSPPIQAYSQCILYSWPNRMVKGSFYYPGPRKNQCTNPFLNWLVCSFLIPYSLSHLPSRHIVSVYCIPGQIKQSRAHSNTLNIDKTSAQICFQIGWFVPFEYLIFSDTLPSRAAHRRRKHTGVRAVFTGNCLYRQSLRFSMQWTGRPTAKYRWTRPSIAIYGCHTGYFFIGNVKRL